MNLMFDSITISAIPHGAQATAGYVNGRWPNSTAMQAAFPSLPHVSIAISADVDADCLDVEPGDATIAQAPAWVDRQHARGVALPIVYTSASNVTALRGALGSRQYLLWAAHYDYNPHVCGSCGYPGADATQFADRGPNGENVDQTLMSDRFFAAISGTAPTTPPGDDMPSPADLWNAPLAGPNGQAATGQQLLWSTNQATYDVAHSVAAVAGQIAGLVAAIHSLAAGGPVDLAAVEAAAAKGTQDALRAAGAAMASASTPKA